MEPRTLLESWQIKAAAITMLVLGWLAISTIEYCCACNIEEGLKVAAYQGCRVGISSRSTQEIVERQVKSVLQAHKINDFSISMSQDPAQLTRGETLTVRVDARMKDNLPHLRWLLKANRNLSASASLVTE